RLSIIDVAGGRQPIYNEDKSICVVFNGQIYNYLELRDILVKKGHYFYTQTDTEVIVHAYEEFGLEFVQKLNGMFAIALWDKRKARLMLIRDRLGIKPLYYARIKGGLIFASEITALKFEKSIDFSLYAGAIESLFTLRYNAHEEATIYTGIKKLPPAQFLLYGKDGFEKRTYWSLTSAEDAQISIVEATDKFLDLVRDSVRLRMRSDVPVGIHLSGGIDSFLLTWLACEQAPQISSYTLGFGTDLDERKKALRASEYFEIENHSKNIDWETFIPDVTEAMRFCDEPFLCPNILLNYHIAKFNRDFVKVVLCGDGADEFLGGYIHHVVLHYFDKFRADKARIRALVQGVPSWFANFGFYPVPLGPESKQRVLHMLDETDDIRRYFSLVSFFTKNELKSLFAFDLMQQPEWEQRLGMRLANQDLAFLNKIILYESRTWLSEFMLPKLDRMSMASSVETRVPFLDYRLVEFFMKLPASYKIYFLQRKYILKKLIALNHPHSFASQKKHPFTLPLSALMTDKNVSHISEVIRDTTQKQKAIFNISFVEKLLNDFPGQSQNLFLNKRVMSLFTWCVWSDLHLSRASEHA
nr:asparagine synthase (glutamine-hydrolyzing) [Candidatus Omnitrophota bacterium]